MSVRLSTEKELKRFYSTILRWDEDGLPKMKFDDIEEVMSILLDDSGLRLENRTVDRADASITQPWSEDRINMVNNDTLC